MPSEERDRIDEDTLRRVQARDEAAARELFDRYMPSLRAQVRRTLHPTIRRKVSESDVIQEAYIAAFLGLGDFEDRGEESFRRWLGKILQHKILTEARRYAGTTKRDTRREVSLGGEPLDRLERGGDPSPSMHVMALEERAALWQAVDSLPGDYRTIIRFVHHGGLSLKEAGLRMGRSADAARKLYGRAIARLTDGVDPSEDSTR